jgi:hypothetical protein
MRFLLRILLIGIFVYAALSVVRSLFAPSTTPARRTSNTGKLVKDPVCGMYVAQETALQERGSFFCSDECRQKFLAG